MDPKQMLLYAAVLVIALICIAVAQYFNSRKSAHRRAVIKSGPVIERFTDPEKAVREGDVILTRDQAQLKAMQWWDRSGVASGVCGVCNQSIKQPDGYMVPLKRVTGSKTYLEKACGPIMEFGVAIEDAETQICEQILADKTPWLVCNNCIGNFYDA